MKSLLRVTVLLVVIALLFSVGANSVLALNEFRSTTVATFRSIDPYGSTSKEFSIGDRNIFLSRVYIEPRNSEVRLKSITFTNLGTAEDGDIRNVSLYKGDTRIAGPFDSISNIVMNFPIPYLIQPEFPVTFDLKGDIVGGAGKTVGFDPVTSENIQLVDEYNADNIRLYKSEESQTIVLDTIKGSGTSGTSGESGTEGEEGTDPPASSGVSEETEETEGTEGTTENPFPDTTLDDIEGEAAADLHQRGIISGYPDGEFKGSKDVNRVEALKILLEAKFGDINPREFDGRFSDVSEEEWYVLYLMRALDLGIISGYPDGTFKPGNTVNTVEFLKMMILTFGIEEGLEYTYGDVGDSDWFSKYAGAAETYEMFPDRPHFLVPASELTRNEMVVAIYQYLKNKE